MNAALKPSEILTKAADLIEPEGAWTRYVRARDARDCPVPVSDSRAVCFCIVGAIERVSGNDNPYDAPELRWVSRVTRASEAAAWNDQTSRRQETVVAALRKASALAAEEGQ